MSSASSQKNNKALNADALSGSSPTSETTPKVTTPTPSQPDPSQPNFSGSSAEPAVNLAPPQQSVQISTDSIVENPIAEGPVAESQEPEDQANAVPLESGIVHFLRHIAPPNLLPNQTPAEKAPTERTQEEKALEEKALEEKSSPEPSATDDFGQFGFAGVDIRKMAAEGYFQAIAYWLNEPLIPQQVYAQVLADDVPGRIKVLIEFERAPQPQRLIRFVCDRLYKLNSDVIEGVHLIARALGAAKTDWEKSIRIPTATQRQQKRASKQFAATATPQTATPQTATPQTAAPQRQATPLPAAEPNRSPHPRLVHESTRIHIARQAVRSQFKFFRAALVTGTAAAAFLFGGFTELVLSEKLPVPPQNQNITPWYGNETVAFDETAAFDQALQPNRPSATNVSFRPASRFQGRTVEAALETVAVSPHDDVANPSDPTITLLFGGELNLNNFNFSENEDLDNLFSEIDIYQQADVAMVGLGEPLANASTSLQEDFYQRTRPQAVKTLKTGGIDIVGLAGEGNLTYGARGLGETLTNLDRQGIYRVGAGRNQREAHRPEILEVKGQRIAYLGYNPDATKGAKAEKAGVALTTSEDRKHIIEDIKAIRSQVDWIVVNYRWGNTLTPSRETPSETTISDTSHSTQASDAQKTSLLTASIPEDWQKSLAREAVDAGADLVVGYHPKNLQGVEIYHDRAIAYSLGDFVFGEAPLENHDTAALRVSLRNQQMKVEFLPITIRESKLQMATGEHGAAILQTIRNASRSFEQPMRFPAVLDAKPNRYLPASLHKTDLTPSSVEATQQPDAEALYESVNDLSGDGFEYETPTLNEPATDPRLQAPEALFIPTEDNLAEDNLTEENLTEETTDLENAPAITPANERVQEEWLSDSDEPQPWQDPWEDEALLENSVESPPSQSNLDDWGEKNTDADSAFEPIPAGTLQRQLQEDAPEEISPRSTPPEEIWFDDLENNRDTYPEDIYPEDIYPEDAYTAPINEPVSEADTTEISITPQENPQENNQENNQESNRIGEPSPTSIEIVSPSAPDVIAPYEEPLVGPLSARPEGPLTPQKPVQDKPITAALNID